MQPIQPLINGIPSSKLEVTDRAIAFGDGVFTTFRILAGQIQHLESHLTRLQSGCQLLGIQGVNWQAVASEMQLNAMQADASLAVGKAIITRGRGGRGYSPEGVSEPSRIISTFAFPSHVASWRKQGIALVLGQLQLAIQPALAGLKTLNRLEQILAKQELIERGAVEGIFCDTQGYLVECNAANLFWRVGDKLYTPELKGSGVAGIMRKKIMEFCQLHHSEVTECQALPAVLEDADELFISNSITGPVPVLRFEEKQYDSHFMCRLLQKELDPLPKEVGSQS